MKSPLYPDVEMKQVVKNGITIDYCPRSGGVWLDKGELEKLIELGTVANINEQDNIPFSDKNNSSQKKQEKRENPLMDLFDFF